MKIGIMQPYFLPYIGYWQLVNSVDTFVIYDNIQYTKKGWINRNRFLQNGSDVYFTIPLKKESDYLDVNQRHISENFDRTKMLNQIRQAYAKAPYFPEVFQLFEQIVRCEQENLFDFIFHSFLSVYKYLEMETKIIKSSTIDINHELKAEDKVIAICENLHTDTYINAIGGMELYSTQRFRNSNIELKFIKSNNIVYNQFKNEFVPWLSILDVLMFNSRNEVKTMLKEYVLLEGK